MSRSTHCWHGLAVPGGVARSRVMDPLHTTPCQPRVRCTGLGHAGQEVHRDVEIGLPGVRGCLRRRGRPGVQRRRGQHHQGKAAGQAHRLGSAARQPGSGPGPGAHEPLAPHGCRCGTCAAPAGPPRSLPCCSRATATRSRACACPQTARTCCPTAPTTRCASGTCGPTHRPTGVPRCSQVWTSGQGMLGRGAAWMAECCCVRACQGCACDARDLVLCAGHLHNFEKNLLRCDYSADGSRVTGGSADRMVRTAELQRADACSAVLFWGGNKLPKSV
jgi:hypothetical protein